MANPHGRRVVRAAFGLIALAALAACGESRPPDIPKLDPKVQRDYEKHGSLTGGPLVLRTGREREEPGRVGIGVNAYLWRAALDTLDFVPIAQADPFGGVIISEWYRPAEKPDERFRITVLIKDTRLRASAVEVSVHKQVRAPDGGWLDAPVDEKLARELEDRILTRARELRLTDVRETG
ncbi:hypothetical protein HRbin39_01742 [bacterium HR39]|nr:hypothetical protein HRbin39_01742 [bacterium HR39]